MPARTGEQYLKGLKASNRELWIGTDRVDDVTEHPATRGAAHQMADVFDPQHAFAEDCLMPDPETGEPINVSHMIPRSRRGPAAPPPGPRPDRRVDGRAHGPHPRLHERHLRRVRRSLA